MFINRERRYYKDKDKDKDCFLKRNILVLEKSRAKLCSDKEAESGAERLVRALKAKDSREFMLKVMYHLPYDTRERILESSLKPGVNNPKRYFLYCAKKELDRLGL